MNTTVSENQLLMVMRVFAAHLISLNVQLTLTTQNNITLLFGANSWSFVLLSFNLLIENLNL